MVNSGNVRSGLYTTTNTSCMDSRVSPEWFGHKNKPHPYLSVLKAHLHYGRNCAKLAGFKEQKKYFALIKIAGLAQIFAIKARVHWRSFYTIMPAMATLYHLPLLP